MKIKRPANNAERVRRYRMLEDYVRHWPYSPYTEFEYKELADVVEQAMLGIDPREVKD